MANKKISELTELIRPSSVDLLPIVDDPAGTPVTKKITITNLIPSIDFSFPDYNEADQGLTGNGRSAKAYIDTIGTTNSGTLVFRHNSGGATTTYQFSTDETIPSNIKVVIEKGAILSIDSGVTLTINGSFSAGLYQVFSGDKSVSFGSGAVTKVYPQWFGVVGDGTTDGKDAFKACLAACNGQTIKFVKSNYSMTGPIYLVPNNRIEVAPGTVFSKPSDGSDLGWWRFDNITNTTIYAYGVVWKYATKPSVDEHRHIFDIRGSSNITICGATARDSGGDGFYIGSSTTDASDYSENIILKDVIADNNRRQGCSITNAKNVYVYNSQFINTTGTSPQAGVDIEPNSATDIIENINFINCKSANNSGGGFTARFGGAINTPISINFIGCVDNGSNGGFSIQSWQAQDGCVRIINCDSFYSLWNGLDINESNVKVLVDNLYIHNPNQSEGTTNRYGSGVSVYTTDDNLNAGNIRVRNSEVFADDDKMLKAITLQEVGGLTGAEIQNIDIEIKTNQTGSKVVVKSPVASDQCDVKFLKEIVFANTGTISSALPNYVYQKITNEGATGATTINLQYEQNFGTEFTFEVVAAQEMYIQANTADGYLPIDPGDYTTIHSNTPGNRLKLKNDGTSWKIIEEIGTWTKS